jgi:DNA invertase Pin-like site-specific DNA recombinase
VTELKIGYARVSTVDQDLTAQRDALVALGVDPKRIYVDPGLTGASRDRPGLRQALAACRRGDTLVVTKLDRLARSVPDACDIVDELTAGGVRLNIVGSLHDPTDPVGRLLFTTLAIIAEFEADLARARTREGNGRRTRQRPAARQAAQAQPEAGGPPGRVVPRRRAHPRRTRGTVPRHTLHDLPSSRSRRRAHVAAREGQAETGPYPPSDPELTKSDRHSGPTGQLHRSHDHENTQNRSAAKPTPIWASYPVGAGGGPAMPAIDRSRYSTLVVSARVVRTPTGP